MPPPPPRQLQSQTKGSWRGCTTLTVVHFNPQKREFSLLLNTPRPPYSMLRYNKTITRTNINVLLNIGPGTRGGEEGGGKKEVIKQASQHFWRWLQKKSTVTITSQDGAVRKIKVSYSLNWWIILYLVKNLDSAVLPITYNYPSIAKICCRHWKP